MGRPRLAILAALAAAAVGCEHKDWTPPPSPASRPVKTVASMVPAATDLIVGMGLRDRLVAVSTYDADRPDVGALPKAGAYAQTDWEQIAAVKPSVLTTDAAADRRPAGFMQHAADLHIDVLRVHIDRLDDIAKAIDDLGEKLDAKPAATEARRQFTGKIDVVRRLAAGQPPVAALIVVGPDAQMLAGPGTYLDDLLTVAGGTNVAAPLGRPWPEVDREMLRSLKPDVILQLIPGATPQQKARAAAVWAELPMIPAVAAGRVVTLADPYAQQPGWHVADEAEQFGRGLHPTAMSGITVPTTRPAP